MLGCTIISEFMKFLVYFYKGRCINDVLRSDNACWEHGRKLLPELLPTGRGGVPRLQSLHFPVRQTREEEAPLFVYGTWRTGVSVHDIPRPVWR